MTETEEENKIEILSSNIDDEYKIAEIKLDKFLKCQSELLQDKNERFNFYIKNKKLDLRLQINKAKSFLDLYRIPVIFLTDRNKLLILNGVVYSTSLGTFVKFYHKNLFYCKEIKNLFDFEYPNNYSEYGVLLADYSPYSIALIKNFGLTESIIKNCLDVEDSLRSIEKNYLAKRLSEFFQNDKIFMGILLLIGFIIGFIAKTIIN